jgi:uncharacterized protein (UPF0218 family)
MRFTETERNALKKPFGVLVPQGKITRRSIVKFLGNCRSVASVGDETTNVLLTFGIVPTISITDGKTMRKVIRTSKNRKYDSLINYLLDERIAELRCKNPAGSISDEAYGIIIRSIQNGSRVKILVDGEEDLLAIPLFAFLPKRSVLAYGQPNEGLVLTRICPKIQTVAKDLLTRFDITV